MAYAYKPMYYSSFQDTIASLCKSILPFSFKSRLLQADQKQAKRHAENLKWQQESFHRILHLIGLHNEGIVPEAEVAAFRSNLLDTLIASPAELELPNIIRDKLLFLQELLFAKCICSEEYHSSKRPLLQRLAAQGIEIDCRDVIVGTPPLLKNSEEEWSDIDLNDQEPPEASMASLGVLNPKPMFFQKRLPPLPGLSPLAGFFEHKNDFCCLRKAFSACIKYY